MFILGVLQIFNLLDLKSDPNKLRSTLVAIFLSISYKTIGEWEIPKRTKINANRTDSNYNPGKKKYLGSS
jgi:hypothetical protein